MRNKKKIRRIRIDCLVSTVSLIMTIILVLSVVTHINTKASVKLRIIKPSSSVLVIAPGKSYKIKVSNRSGKKLRFSSSNKKALTVNSKGVIKAKSLTGKSVITVKGYGKAKFTVKIGIPVSRLDMITEALQINVGYTYALDLKFSPSNALYKKVSWISSDSSCASVSDGIVTAKSAGIAIISAKAADGSNKGCYCVVNVTKPSNNENKCTPYPLIPSNIIIEQTPTPTPTQTPIQTPTPTPEIQNPTKSPEPVITQTPTTGPETSTTPLPTQTPDPNNTTTPTQTPDSNNK